MLKIIRITSDNQDFQNLVKELDIELAIRDGKEHAFFAQFNKLNAIKNVVVVYQNETAVGCSAFKKFDDETININKCLFNLNITERELP